MPSTVISYSPKFMQFALSLLIMLLLYASAGGAFYLISSASDDGSFFSYLEGIWPFLVLSPVMCSAIQAYVSRKHQLCVSGLKNPGVVAEWILESLKQEGLRVRTINGNELVLESKKKYNRTFGHWFGTELVKVSYTGNEVIAIGNYRYTDALGSKIRFGKVGAR